MERQMATNDAPNPQETSVNNPTPTQEPAVTDQTPTQEPAVNPDPTGTQPMGTGAPREQQRLIEQQGGNNPPPRLPSAPPADDFEDEPNASGFPWWIAGLFAALLLVGLAFWGWIYYGDSTEPATVETSAPSVNELAQLRAVDNNHGEQIDRLDRENGEQGEAITALQGTVQTGTVNIPSCEPDLSLIPSELKGQSGIWTPFITEFQTSARPYGTFTADVCSGLGRPARRHCSQFTRWLMFAQRCDSSSAADVVTHTRTLEGI